MTYVLCIMKIIKGGWRPLLAPVPTVRQFLLVVSIYKADIYMIHTKKYRIRIIFGLGIDLFDNDIIKLIEFQFP
jgi:hypothetical protein